MALAWYTQGGGSRVQIAWSGDGGRSFGAAQRVDAGGALGRVDACAGPDGRVLVSWLQQQTDASGWIARGFDADQSAGERFMIGAGATGRDVGMLRLAADARGWLAAWTADGGRGLRCARVLPPTP